MHAKLMIHDPRVDRIGGTALEIDMKSKDMMKVREIIASIIAKHAGKSIDEILEKTSTDTYFDTNAAISYGLADTILDKM